MHTITITVESEETKWEILDALCEASESGEITDAFNVQTDETYDPDADSYSDGDNPAEAFVISDFDDGVTF
jgi:hypothetical protein